MVIRISKLVLFFRSRVRSRYLWEVSSGERFLDFCGYRGKVKVLLFGGMCLFFSRIINRFGLFSIVYL